VRSSSTALSIKCVGTWRCRYFRLKRRSTGVLDRARQALTSALGASDGRLAAIRVPTRGASAAHELCATQAGRLTEEMRALASDLRVRCGWRRSSSPPARFRTRVAP